VRHSLFVGLWIDEFKPRRVMSAATLRKFDAKIRDVPRSGFGKRDLCVGTLHKVCKSYAGI
jgi:hypothetical protein